MKITKDINQSYAQNRLSLPFPIRLFPVGEQFLIEWCTERDGNPVNIEFLEEQQQKWNVQGERKFSILSDEENEEKKLLKPSIFIFHVSRCGSTLAANYLASDKTNRVYAEPELLIETLYEANINDLSTKSRLKKAIQVLGLGAFPQQQNLMIKLTDIDVKYMPLFEELYPNVPKWLIIRKPTEVIASNLKNPSRRLINSLSQQKNLNKTMEEHILSSFEEVFSLCLRYKASFDEIIDYAQLKSKLSKLYNDFISSHSGAKVFVPDQQAINSYSKKEHKKFISDNYNAEEICEGKDLSKLNGYYQKLLVEGKALE